MAKLGKKASKNIDECVEHFIEMRPLFETFARSVHDHLRDDPQLAKYIQFIKCRVKTAKRLREKLEKKLVAGAHPAITPANLFEQVNDLGGVRLLHLHLDQLGEVVSHIKRVLDASEIRIAEGPIANCWDLEYEQFFKDLKIKTADRVSMYTSLHYVLEANKRTKITCELQVRTLAEELWGEISHRVAYEEETPDPRTLRQLQVLARITSGATRLVDCIMRDAGH
jgi:ppGpp synthetase/RelA/SpoT-type nucleotidyltranferase